MTVQSVRLARHSQSSVQFVLPSYGKLNKLKILIHSSLKISLEMPTSQRQKTDALNQYSYVHLPSYIRHQLHLAYTVQ